MFRFSFSTTFALLLAAAAAAAKAAPSTKHVEVVRAAREGMQEAIDWAHGFSTLNGPGREPGFPSAALRDCAVLYEDAESRLGRLVSGEWGDDDAVSWVSAALAGHNTCLDGLGDHPFEARRVHNLTSLIRRALAVSANPRGKRKGKFLYICCLHFNHHYFIFNFFIITVFIGFCWREQ